MNTVYLTSTGDAVQDILQNPRYEGAVDSIAFITSFIDQYFVIFISIVAFFIISVALLRNVVAGAYCAYPKFWDKVANAHEAAISNMQSKGSMGSIAAFFLSLIPNVKEMSDFADDTVSPKHYFVKAIPKMFAIVFIGVFVYNGYYRDLTVKTSQFGSVVFQRFILGVDPTEVVDRIVQNTYQPKVTAESGKDSRSKYVAKMTKDLYSAIMSRYNDITDRNVKDSIMANIEQEMWSFVNGTNVINPSLPTVDGLFDTDKYKVNTEVYLYSRVPDINEITKTDTPEKFTMYYAKNAVDTFGISSTRGKGESTYAVVKAYHEKLPDKAVKGGTNWLARYNADTNLSKLDGLVSKGFGSIQLQGVGLDNGKQVVLKYADGKLVRSETKLNGVTASTLSGLFKITGFDASLTINKQNIVSTDKTSVQTSVNYVEFTSGGQGNVVISNKGLDGPWMAPFNSDEELNNYMKSDIKQPGTTITPKPVTQPANGEQPSPKPNSPVNNF